MEQLDTRLREGQVNRQKTSITKDGLTLTKNGVKDIYEDSYAPLEARVQNLLSQMTLEEKKLPDGYTVWFRPRTQ